MNLAELKAAVDALLASGVEPTLPVAYDDCEHGPTMIGSVEAKDGDVDTVFAGRYFGPFVLLRCNLPAKEGQ